LPAVAVALMAAPLAAQTAWTGAIAGSYQGALMSGGKSMPVTTQLTVGANQVRGSYTFVEDGSVQVPGTLESCVPVRPQVLSCKWRDRYGDGTLEMTFASDSRSFNGRWSASDEPGKWYPWSGRKG
jgi:hypothetical protein